MFRPDGGVTASRALTCLTLLAIVPSWPLFSRPSPQPIFQPVEGVGLSQQTIFAIQQDGEGFLWFGTGDGLNRWDGYEVVVFRHDPWDTGTLSGNLVSSLAIGRGARLWVGTDNGVSLYDPRTEGFGRVRFGDDREDSAVEALLEDALGRLWVVFPGSLWLVDPATLSAERVRMEGSLRDLSVRALQVVEGDVWLEPTNRDAPLIRVVEGEGAIRLEVGVEMPSSGWQSLPLWSQRDLPPFLSDFQPSRLPAPVIAGMQPASLETRDGKVWIASHSGLVSFDPDREEINLHQMLTGEDNLANLVRSIFEDADGTLWVGTFNGLFRNDPYRKPFRHYSPVRGRAGETIAETAAVSSLLPGDNGVWMGTFGSGLLLWDPPQAVIRQFLTRPDDSTSLWDDFVWSLHRGDRGRLWVGTPQGLCSLDPGSNRFSRYPADTGSESGPVNVRSMVSDGQGRLWLATTTGLHVLEPSKDKVRRFSTASGNSELLGKSLESILFSDRSGSGSLWIGTADNQVIRFDLETGEITSVDLAEEFQTGPGMGVWSLLEASDGKLWIGWGLGLSRYDEKTGKIRHFGIRDGLPGAVVYSLAEDPQGRLWLGTNQGLSLLQHPEADAPEITNLGRAEGVVNREFNRRAAAVDNQGNVFFGGLAGVTFFHSFRTLRNPRPPRIALTGIQVESDSGVRSVNPFGLERLTLQPSDYAVSFQFTALSFTNPSSNGYRHQMEGVDPGWVEAGTQRWARYVSLQPGEYTFRVTGSNGDGVWNSSGRSLAVLVVPPFWRTSWFQLLVAAFLIGVVILLYRYRVSRLLEMERLRLRVAEDLHDDLGSNLSGVALLGEGLLSSGRLQGRQKEQLQRIVAGARKMVEDLRDIVWMVDPKQDTLEDLVGRMREVAEDLLSETEYVIAAPAQTATGLGMETRRQLFLVFKEAVHNAARHAEAKQVRITLKREASELVLSVSDDGRGFGADRPQGQGLRSMQRRARRLGSRLEVESAPGRGTRVSLRVKIA